MIKLLALAALLAACHHDGHGHHGEAARIPTTTATPMTEVGIAVPIAAGKTAAWRASIEELTGPRYAEYAASRQRFGLTAQATFLQRTPMGDFAVIHMTGPDVHASFHAMSSSRDAWDVKWRELTRDLHGVDFGQGERVMPQVTPLFSTGPDLDGGPPFMFLAPLGVGGAERMRAVAAEMMGPRHDAYVAARAKIGVRREATFLESTALGDAVVVFWRADDPAAALRLLAASTDPLDVWLRNQARQAHPIPLETVTAIAGSNALIGEWPHH